MAEFDIAQLAAVVEVRDSASVVLQKIQGQMEKSVITAGETLPAATDKTAAASRRVGLQGVQAFGALQGAIGTAGNPLGPLNQGIQQTLGMLYGAQSLSEGFGRKMFIAGGSMAAVGAIATQLGGDLSKSEAQLRQSVQSSGGQYGDYAKRIKEAQGAAEDFGITHKELNEGLSRLVTGFGNADTAMKYLGETEDLAKFKHISLSQAAKEMIRMYEGYARGAKELGINMTMTHNASKGLESAEKQQATATKTVQAAELNLLGVQEKVKDGRLKGVAATDAVRAAELKLIDAHNKAGQAADTVKQKQAAVNAENAQGSAILDQVNKKVEGQARAQAQTLGGQLDRIKTKVIDFFAVFGQKYGPAVTAVGSLAAGAAAAAPAFAAAGRGIAGMASGLVKLVPFLWDAAAGLGAMAVDAAIAAAPFIAIAAVIAIVIAAAYLLWTNWDKVWNWIKDHPAIAVVISILAAPIAAFVLLVGALHWLYQNWRQIWDVIKSVTTSAWNFIRPIVMAFKQLFDDVIGFISALIHGDFDAAWQAFKNIVVDAWNLVWTTIQVIATAIINWVSQLPGKIVAAMEALAGLLYTWGDAAFHAAWNAMMDVVSSIVGWVGGIPRQMLDAIKDLGGILEHIGERIMNGLWNGMKSIWHDIEGWLGGLGDWITSLKGPPAKDAVLLYDNGRLIMGGFQRGLAHGWSQVQDQLSGYNAAVAGSFQPDPSTVAAGGRYGARAGGAGALGNQVAGPTVHVTVHGSVMTERDLAESLRNSLVRTGQVTGGNVLGDEL